MNDIITVTGVVATTPRHLVTTEGLAITSLRLASSHRHFDQTTKEWVDGDTNWYTVTGFRQLAINVAGSVNKGDRVIVSGKLKVKEWESGGKSGKDIEIVADNVGHDLRWGTSSFVRVSRAAAGAGSAPTESHETEPGDYTTGEDSSEGWAPEPVEGEAVETDGFLPARAAG